MVIPVFRLQQQSDDICCVGDYHCRYPPHVFLLPCIPDGGNFRYGARNHIVELQTIVGVIIYFSVKRATVDGHIASAVGYNPTCVFFFDKSPISTHIFFQLPAQFAFLESFAGNVGQESDVWSLNIRTVGRDVFVVLKLVVIRRICDSHILLQIFRIVVQLLFRTGAEEIFLCLHPFHIFIFFLDFVPLKRVNFLSVFYFFRPTYKLHAIELVRIEFGHIYLMVEARCAFDFKSDATVVVFQILCRFAVFIK